MAGYRSWTPGEILTADNVQDYLQDQTVMVFSGTAVRGTAIPTPTEGMLTFITDIDKFQYYDGSAWETLVPITGGTSGQPYVSGGTADAAFGDMNAKYIQTTIQNKTAAYTAVASDTNTLINVTGTASAQITIPDVMTDIGDMIQVLRNTSGTVTIAAGTGVTSWAGVGTAGTAVVFTIDTQYAAAGVLKTGTNEYRIIGKVAA